MNTKNKDTVVLHGEAMIISRNSLPLGAKKKNLTGHPYFKIADSETTGNHHVLELGEDTDVAVYETEDGKTFASSTTGFNVKCVHPDRHSTAHFPPGTYEFGIQKEYDPFAESLRRVAD